MAILDFAGGERVPPAPLGWYFSYFSSTQKGVERVRHLAEDSPIIRSESSSWPCSCHIKRVRIVKFQESINLIIATQVARILDNI